MSLSIMEFELTCEAYLSHWPDEQAHIEFALSKIRAGNGSISARSTFPGHLTGSAFITHGSSVLMVWHPTLERWLQSGGHVDPGENPKQAALRELAEETGLQIGFDTAVSESLPFDIDCHAIPANPRKGEPSHWHIDCRYHIEISDPESMSRSASAELKTRWLSIAELANLGGDFYKILKKMTEN